MKPRLLRQHWIFGFFSIAFLAVTSRAAETAGSLTAAMARRPFVPTDTTLFAPNFGSLSIYPNSTLLPPAAGAEPDEQTALALLTEYMTAESPSVMAAALALYKDPIAKAVIPDPPLRAAFAALKGTIGEPAIDFILNAQNPDGGAAVAFVGFGFLNFGQIAIIQVVPVSNQLVITFNLRYAAENPFLFVQILAHEVLHQYPLQAGPDGSVQVPVYEEATALTIHTLLYLDQLAQHPELARTGTELSQVLNSLALLRLNSGAGARLGLFDANNASAAGFWDAVLAIHPEIWFLAPSKGHDLLGKYLRNIAEDPSNVFQSTEFNSDLLHWISANQGSYVSNNKLLRAAQALKLNTGITFPSAPTLDLHGATLTDVLNARPLPPTDTNLFVDTIYPDAAPVHFADGTMPDEAACLDLLNAYMAVESPSVAAAALAVYNDIFAKVVVCEPPVRAAFAALNGTIAEPFINYALNATNPDGSPKVAFVGFGFVASGLLASSTAVAGQLVITLPSHDVAENPFLFVPLLAHEALHQNPPSYDSIFRPLEPFYEEVTAQAFHTVIYLDQLAQHPELARAGASSARDLNYQAMAHLNSGLGPRLGLFESNGHAPVWPGSPWMANSFFEYLQNLLDHFPIPSFGGYSFAYTPGHDLLGQYLHNIADDPANVISSSQFNDDLLHWISSNQGPFLSNNKLVRAAQALGLNLLSK